MRHRLEVSEQLGAVGNRFESATHGDLERSGIVPNPPVRTFVLSNLDHYGRTAFPLRLIPSAQADSSVCDLLDRLDPGIPFELVAVVGQVVECLLPRAADRY